MADRSRLAGWGNLPVVAGREISGEDLAALTDGAVLTRGLGRSYGDASLPPPGVEHLPTSRLADRILEFDESTGLLRAEAGLTVGEIQRHFLPRGWTFPVLPGTQFVTLGGAVAADIHGKNHHRDGSVGRHLEELLLRLADGRLATASRDHNPDLFRATLGGMGLTGHVLEVSVRLQAVPSPWIWGDACRIHGIDEFLPALRAAAREWPFTVGWFDVLARGSHLGRGVLFRGRWATPEEAPRQAPPPKRRYTVPFQAPGWLLNRATMRLFNELYYRRHPRRPRAGLLHPETFFHPLDSLLHWNRVYGRRGFTQYQCVLPESERPGATRRFLEHLAALRAASFLCVIKDLGEEGEGLLSFPRPGITVTIDLPAHRGLASQIDALNEKVLAEGGRIYLAKDALTTAARFRDLEPRLPAFEEARRRWDPELRLGSALWNRLTGAAATGTGPSAPGTEDES